MSVRAPAGYLPEKLIIKLRTIVPLLDSDENPAPFETSAGFAVFIHEYIHYIHNISTVCGLSGFFNTIELWRVFRCTIGKNGLSVGSSQLDIPTQDHLKRLLDVLIAGREIKKLPLHNILNPVSLKILSVSTEQAVEDFQGTLLTKFVCKAEVGDGRGNVECCQIKIGIPEIMESAAWLLERRLVSSLDPYAAEIPVDVYPYKTVSALAQHLDPGIKDEAILTSILSALQSSDAAKGLQQVLQLALKADKSGHDVCEIIHDATIKVITDNEPVLYSYLSKLEVEFSDKNIMADGIRTIISSARHILALRREDPFFEISLLDSIANGFDINKWMTEFPPCIVLQESAGSNDKLMRDKLVSFIPLNSDGSDPEVSLRVIHAIFDFMGRHVAPDGVIVPTQDLPKKQCPFFTCCGLKLRVNEPVICSCTPWLAADWNDWDEKGACWYGVAVKITR